VTDGPRGAVEERTREVANLAREIVEHGDQWFWETDSEHRYFKGPLFAGSLHRLPFDDVVGLTREQIADPEDLRAEPDKWRRHREDLENRRPFKAFDYRLRRPDGSIGWIRASGWPVYSKAGDFLGYRGTATSIDEHKTQLAALAESEACFELATTAAKLGIWQWCPGSDRFVLSANLKKMLGFRDAQLPDSKEAWLQRVHPEDRAQVEEAMIRAAKRGPGTSFEVSCRLTHKNGGVRWGQLRGHIPDIDDGSEPQMIGAVADITERALVQQALVDSERRMATLLANLPGMVYRCRNDADWTMEFVSDGCLALTGYRTDELLSGAQVSYGREVVHPDDQERVWNEVREAVARGEPFALSYRIVTAHGRQKWVWEQGRAVHKADGSPPALEGFITDVTESRQSERELNAQYRRLLLAEEVAGIGHWQLDLAANEVVWSDQTYRIHGVTPETFELTLESALAFYPPGEVEVVQRHLAEAIEHKQGFEFALHIQRPDGELRDVHSVGRCHTNDAGEVDYLFGVFRDVTDRKAIEAQLLQAQKMEAVGQLTGGIAHDFNNILTVILGNLQLLERHLPGDDKASKLLQAATTATLRGADLTKRLLAFGRRQLLEPKVADVNELVGGVGDLLRRTLGETVEIEASLADDLWPVCADVNQLENALLNLAINARDAMPDGGQLIIETRNANLGEAYAASYAEVTAGDYVMLAVSDTGTGMPKDVIEHAFEPFYTTKETGKGSGLGLSMVYGFVKQSGGHIKIYSEAGHGTTVKIYLPREETSKQNDIGHDKVPAEVPKGDQTILVVEDDMAVREVAVALLESTGYRVLVAEDGTTGLTVLENHPDIDLLFTDVVMPGGMSGPDLARAARERRPDLKVLFSSGYAESAMVHRGILDPGAKLLGKPYRNEDLAETVHQVLRE
jgi:PAS domain S-box-containing protein